jgi:hypothetical protein
VLKFRFGRGFQDFVGIFFGQIYYFLVESVFVSEQDLSFWRGCRSCYAASFQVFLRLFIYEDDNNDGVGDNEDNNDGDDDEEDNNDDDEDGGGDDPDYVDGDGSNSSDSEHFG